MKRWSLLSYNKDDSGREFLPGNNMPLIPGKLAKKRQIITRRNTEKLEKEIVDIEIELTSTRKEDAEEVEDFCKHFLIASVRLNSGTLKIDRKL